jgi:hypothetical protein
MTRNYGQVVRSDKASRLRRTIIGTIRARQLHDSNEGPESPWLATKLR